MSETPSDNSQRNPFTRPGFIISAALIAALISAVIAIVAFPTADEPDAGGTTQQTARADETTAAEPGVAASVCGLPPSEDTALGTAPDSNWELISGIAVPSEPSMVGPGMVSDDGFRWCFAHSPKGALYAAVNIFALGSTGDLAIQERIVEDLTAPGPGREEAFDNIGPASTAGPSIQVAGFQLRSYDGRSAVVDLAFRTSAGAVGHVVMPLEWVGGDWKITVGDNGQLINEPVQLNDLNDYISWNGV